ncbi:outer membrane protein [Cylindrospermopsis curvispora]|uniref:Outer membrane beta-barrel protein n=1 Tax=Cylindrospermopsis curvispora GIHE-G1 TaxID=2666332 RepID=A0A7H0EYQ8_9CYAN|nr:outer membrane beta-barrel protein [Cylindrospermopsis curvispora]QNP28924.1 outer membrane beta-barrel protein [Cylindrospermopsis curvispora GIHE-G1]
MKIHSFFWFPAVLASLAFTTSVKAEEVSAKAADLMGVSTDNHNTSNLLAQSSDGFTPLAPTPSSTTPLFPGGDVNPDLPASNYGYGSLSVGFGSQSDVNITENGQNWAKFKDFNSAFSFNAAFGYQFQLFRAELEVGNQFLSAKNLDYDLNTRFPRTGTLSGNMSATTILLNSYFDIPTGSKFRPYVGGGLGLGIIRGKILNAPFCDSGCLPGRDYSLDGTAFAYQLKAGLQYEIARKANIFGELKYSSISSYQTPYIGTTDIIGPFNSFGVAIGYRQGF